MENNDRPIDRHLRHIAVVIGGGRLAPTAAALVHPQALIIAADSGLDAAREAGLTPSVLIGDLDSISAAGRMWAYANGVAVHEFPVDKSATDTALAVAHAASVIASERDADTDAHGAIGGATSGAELLVLGGAGDRLDHTLGTIAVLAGDAAAQFATVRAVLGTTTIHMLHSGHRVTLDVLPATTFSLFATARRCEGVTVDGARWPLDNADLVAASTLGVSNETSATPGQATSIAVCVGPLTVVIP